VNKTLQIELSDQRKALVHYFYDAMYRGDLKDWHTDGCEFNLSPENFCDCVLQDAYKLVKKWVRA
jgi:hypothetical protein